MSSSDDQIIQSVDSIISAVETLVEDIQVAPDIDETAKTFALSKVGSVAQDLDLINRALFQNEFPAEGQADTPGVAKTTVTGDIEPSLNEMLSAWAQPAQVTAEPVEPARDEKPKPRIIVSPVKQKTEQDTAIDEQARIKPDDIPLEGASNDELTLIDGIDETVVTLLTKHGIHSFQEIADFREADMMRLSDELRDPCRVSRENWIEQAALLQQGVLTAYAQIESDESRFDRLFYIDAYTSHPVSTAFEPSEWALAEPSSSLSDRLADAEVGQDGAASIEQADEFDGLDANCEEELAPVGFVPHVKSEQSFDEDIADQEPHEETETDGELEAEDFYEPAEPSETDSQEVTEVHAFAETGAKAEHKHEAVPSPDVQELTNALLAKKQALEAELAAITGQMVEKVEQFEVETDERDDPDLAVSHGFVEAEDEHYLDKLTPEVEILTHQDGQNELSELSAHHQEGNFDETVSGADHEQAQSENEPLSSDDLGDGPIWHEEVSTAKDYVPPVVDDYDDTMGQPLNATPHYSHEEQPNGSFSHAEDYQHGHGSETFPYHQDEEFTSNGQASSYQQDMSAEEENSYVYDVNHLADRDPAAHPAHLSGFERSIHTSEQPQGLYPENPNVPPHPEMLTREKQADPVDHMDGISLPREEMGQRSVDFSERPLEQVHHEQPQPMEPPLPPRGPQQEDFREQAEYIQEISRPHLGPEERVSDKVPDVKEQINNGLTLGQYLAAKGQNDRETVAQEDPGALYPPQQREGVEDRELAYQDQSIRLNQSQSGVPNLNLAEVGVPPIAPPPSNLPPVPPAANGLQPTPPMPASSLHRGEGRAMPPLPPSVQQAQNMPLERGQAPVHARNHMQQQRPSGEILDGPTPPPFTDMPEGISEGQAYADTQRIIAAKRKADAEKARNRSEIVDGQAYADTQKLMENGIPLELQQGGERPLLQQNAIPPLPPEALQAAQAYPRGQHNPDIQYRGQKPQAQREAGLPPLPEDAGFNPSSGPERAGEKKSEKTQTGFRAKAKKLAESLQRSFGDKE